jgi:single-strand DNA-binding protein
MPDGLNKVMLIGNLGADPEMKFTANGNALTTFRIACNRTRRMPDGERREETEWFTVVTFNQLAEYVGQYVQKGRKVYVEGRLSTRTWETPDGQKRYFTEVVANQVLSLDRAPAAPLGDDAAGDTDPDDIPFDQ